MRKLFLLVLLSNSFFGYTQKTRQEQSVWFAYLGQYKASKNFGYHFEAQFRMENDLGKSLQNLYRVGANYYLSNKKTVTAGYCLVKTYNKTVDDYLNENRYWEQYQQNHNWKKNAMIHRLRLEQRFVEKLMPTTSNLSYEYQNRFRYLNRNLFHITTLNSEKEQLYGVLQDEIFMNLGDNNVNGKFIDQNRFFVGLGLNYQNNIRLEITYMNHYITSSSNSDLMRHTISLSLIQNLDLFKE